MKLCKKAQILKKANSIQVIIPEKSQLWASYYSNNIGPACIVFDEFKRIKRASFLINNRYTEVPAIIIEPGSRRALFYDCQYSRKEPVVLREVFLSRFYKKDHIFYTVVSAIDKTNSFVEYLNKNNLLGFKLQPIPALI
jgi:hypothetical protein